MKSQENKLSILSWIKNYPVKFVIVTLLVVVPIFLITLFSINFNNNGKKFYFEKMEDKPVYIHPGKVSSNKQIGKHLDLNVTLKEITSYSTGGTTYPLGAYKFETSYKATNEFKNAKFAFRWILNANWTDVQTSSSSVNITGTANTSTIYFPFETPARKYLLFKVGKPTLIIEIKVTSAINENFPTGKTEEITLYYKLDLNKINYAYDIH